MFYFQAMADDEISFDPNDIITNIEMVRMDFKYWRLQNFLVLANAQNPLNFDADMDTDPNPGSALF